jgi:hypothetical protein
MQGVVRNIQGNRPGFEGIVRNEKSHGISELVNMKQAGIK